MSKEIFNPADYELAWQDEQALDEFVRAHTTEQLEKVCLQEEQFECPVINTFGPGVYARTVYFPAGTFFMGHKHKHEHLNVFLQGRMITWQGDGTRREISAPMVFTASPGRKIGYILEDVIWLNIFATEETDIAKLEEKLLEKSEAWEQKQFQIAENKQDPIMLDQFHESSKAIQRFSENEEDQASLPYGNYKICISETPTDKKGVFATSHIVAGELLGPAIIDDKKTPLGIHLNHSKKPTAKLEKFGNDFYLISLKDIQGFKGGTLGDEITIDSQNDLITY